jgi:hypothetical protein
LIILAAIGVTFVMLFAPRAEAVEPQTVSRTSTLTLVILPAIETTSFVEFQQTSSAYEIYQGGEFGLRANTSWNLDISAQNTGFASPATCQASGATGERNLSNRLQRIEISCVQPLSWADEAATNTLEMTYSVSQPL